MDWTRISLACFFSSYLVAFALEAALLLKKLSLSRWLAIGFAAAGLTAQTAYLMVRSQTAQLPPLLSSTHDWLLVLSWLAVALYLFLELIDRRLAVGLFVLPIVLILVGAARFVSDEPNREFDEVVRVWVMLHASALVLSVAGVFTSLVASLMYLMQHNRLKHKRAEPRGLHLLSLEKLSSLNWWAIVVSVPLLTLGMASGVWLSQHSSDTDNPVELGRLEFLIYGTLWAGMAALFAWLLLARRPAGRLVAWRTVWACGILLATILFLSVVSGGGVHGTG